jgi:hypothetical protein
MTRIWHGGRAIATTASGSQPFSFQTDPYPGRAAIDL